MSTIKVNTIQANTTSTLSVGSSVPSLDVTGSVTVGGSVIGNLTGTASTATAAATAYGLSGSPTLSGITSVSTTNLTVNGNAYPSAGPLSNRNKIINGDMRIDQRNAGASVTPTVDNIYTLDRWTARNFGGSGRFSVQQSTASVPAGFSHAAVLTVTTADATNTSTYTLCQRIEGFNTSDLGLGSTTANNISISFWVRSSITGTYCVSVRNDDADRSYVSQYTISAANTWEYKSITLPTVATGTWGVTNGSGLLVDFTLGSNSGRETTAGAWQSGNFISTSNQTEWIATNGATFYITGVQLEAGSVATPFERRSFGDELLKCQRYYSKSYSYQDAPGTNTADSLQGLRNWDTSSRSDVPANVRFPTEMRVAPGVTIYSRNGTIDNLSESSDGITHDANRGITAIRGIGRAGYSTLASSGVSSLQFYVWHWTASAEL